MIFPGLVISSFLLPIAILDMLWFSSRFAGPLARLRRSLNRLAEGEEVPPLYFRKGDFLHDVSRDFNLVLQRLGKLNDYTAADRAAQTSRAAEAPLDSREPEAARVEAFTSSGASPD
jgi:hypothetical protein